MKMVEKRNKSYPLVADGENVSHIQESTKETFFIANSDLTYKKQRGKM